MVSKRGNEIVFDDLADPQFSRLQKLILSLGNKAKTTLTVKAVLDAAKEATGLSDFGSDHFIKPLGVLVDEYDNDDLTPIGRQRLFDDLVRCASNRLVIQHHKTERAGKLEESKITKPLTIAGLPRSGTTNLVNMLAADSRFQKLPLWVGQEPLLAPGKEKTGFGLKRGAKFLAARLKNKNHWVDDPRYFRCAMRWAGMQIMGPEIAAMHPMNPDHIHEELELMTFDFGCNQFEWTSMIPQYRDYYYSTDQTPHYEYMDEVMRLIQIDRDDNRPWVTKNVQNPEQLLALKHIWSDATVIFTHRDPVAVIQSTATMLTWAQRMMRNKIDPKSVLDYWTDRFERLLRACVRDRAIWGPKQSMDVLFHEYMADQMGTLAKIYDLHDMEFTDQAKQEMADFIKAHPRGKHGRVTYKLEEHFGVRPEEIRERFDFYFKTFPVRIEVE